MDWNAERYHAISDPQFEWGRRVLHRLAPQPGERILDLGCGTGRLTTAILEAMGVGHVVGVDRSEPMLRAAVDHAVRLPPVTALHDVAVETSCLSYVQADGQALPFADAFDAVFSAAAMHWMTDHDAVFASVYRALAPGGRFIAQCGGGPNLRGLLDRAGNLLEQHPFAEHAASWTEPWQFADVPTTMVRLERAGFTSIEVTLEPTPTTMPNAAAYAEFVSVICLRSQLTLLPEPLRPSFVQAVTDQAARDDEPFTLDCWRLNIAASKPSVAEQAA
jgi:trans-aconitate 2-methyltransferase